MFDSETNGGGFGSEQANTQPTSIDGYTFTYAPAHPPVRKKRKKGRFMAVIAAACLCVSVLAGFAGGYFSSQTQQSQSASANTPVLYQSVIRTVAAGSGEANQPLSVAEVSAAVKQTVVEITTETVSTNGRLGQYITQGAGSGVIISSDGYIVTNNHVVNGAQSIVVRLYDGTEYSATLVGCDEKTDLAMLKIDAQGLTPAVLGDSSALQVGETTVVIGNPLGELGGTVTSGILSALDREITIDGETMTLLQTDAAVNPGNSGGGLFNLYGELIGIVNAKSSGTDIEGLGFAIPINTAKEVVEDIIAYGYVTGRVDDGLTLVDIQSAQTAMMYRVNQLGLYIADSTHSDFEPGDRITAISGTQVTCLADYNAAMDAYSVGDTIVITVDRYGQSLTISITLTEQHG